MLLLGCLFDRKREKEILSLSRSGISNAANTFQWNLIDGINTQLDSPVNIVNVLPVGTYPKRYKKLWLGQRTWSYKGSKNVEIGGINLPFIKQWIRTRRIKRAIKKSGEKNILIYSTYFPFLKATQKLDASYKITLIVTDLPEFYDLGRTTVIRRYLRKLNNKLLYTCMERVNAFVLLTEQMKEPLCVGERPYVVVEGIAGEQAQEMKNVKSATANKVILYTGSLQYQFGIRSLLDAFALIEDDDYALWICGAGEAKEEIIERAKKDKRIRFFGYITKDEVRELQSQATVLINPRRDEAEYTKYSFPSKTMEYMMSGVPVIMYKLAGIPEEYQEYLYYVNGNTTLDLKNKITEVCTLSEEELALFGAKAKAFVEREKSAKVQAKRILSLME